MRRPGGLDVQRSLYLCGAHPRAGGVAQKKVLACRSRPGSIVAGSGPLEGGAMKYLTFIRHPEKYRDSPPPAALMEAMGKFVEKSLKDGTLVDTGRSEEHTSELQSRFDLVCRLLLEKKNNKAANST